MFGFGVSTIYLCSEFKHFVHLTSTLEQLLELYNGLFH